MIRGQNPTELCCEWIVRPGYLDTFVVIKFDNKHQVALYDLELTIRQRWVSRDHAFSRLYHMFARWK